MKKENTSYTRLTKANEFLTFLSKNGPLFPARGAEYVAFFSFLGNQLFYFDVVLGQKVLAEHVIANPIIPKWEAKIVNAISNYIVYNSKQSQDTFVDCAAFGYDMVKISKKLQELDMFFTAREKAAFSNGSYVVSHMDDSKVVYKFGDEDEFFVERQNNKVWFEYRNRVFSKEEVIALSYVIESALKISEDMLRTSKYNEIRDKLSQLSDEERNQIFKEMGLK